MVLMRSEQTGCQSCGSAQDWGVGKGPEQDDLGVLGVPGNDHCTELCLHFPSKSNSKFKCALNPALVHPVAFCFVQ